VSPDVVVVGCGAIGACSALELARRGACVTIVERGPQPAWGCSAGNAGLITPSHSVPLAGPESLRQGLLWLPRRDSPLRLAPRPELVPWLARFVAASTASRAERGTRILAELAASSVDLHAALAAQLDTGFRRTGCLYVYESEAAFERSAMTGERLDAAAARELEPALRGPIAGAFVERDEAICEPRSFVHAVARAAVDAGAKLQLQTEVSDLADLRADRVVVAAGAWSSRLAPVPVVAGKGYHVDLAGAPTDPRMPVFAQESRVIATPFGDRLRLAGTLELCGLESRFAPRRIEAVRRAGERVLGPMPRGRDLEVWAGLRPCTPDGLPVIGALEEDDRVIVASGHATLGLTLAPITGRLVAELVSGERPSIDLGPLGPDRFRRRLRARA
jgi:D-amino-acid dehydrogenase